MADLIRRDTIDFAAYERDTESASKTRPASDWIEDVLTAFSDRDSGPRHPSMSSTKCGRFLEFRPGEVTVWAGYNGHRKSMFTSQVALDLCAQGQRVLLVSLEMLPAKTIERMAQQASALSRPSAQWSREFGRWTDGRLWLFDHLGRIKPAQALGVCRYFADELHGRHVFIDSMMMVCASEEHMDEQKQFVTDLVRLSQETGLHVHLVTHCRKPQSGDESRPPSKYDVRGSAAISDQAANVVTIWANKAKRANLEMQPHDEEEAAKPDALVSIEKQRNGSWEGRMQMWFHDASLRFCDDRVSPVLPYPIT